jgi:hypothetical protein
MELCASYSKDGAFRVLHSQAASTEFGASKLLLARNGLKVFLADITWFHHIFMLWVAGSQGTRSGFFLRAGS